MEVDRTCFVPPHEGDNVLPLSPFFTRLLRHAHRKPPRPAIRDLRLGIEKDYEQFLVDVLTFRWRVRASLTPDTLEALRQGKEIYIALIAAGGYEYAVGFVAIAALGAAVVPIAASLPVQEASYFILKASCVAIVVSSAAQPLGESLSTHLSRTHKVDILCLAVSPSLQQQQQQQQHPPLRASDITISSNRYLDDNAAGVVIFTSGTTGPPKGAVMRRGFLHDGADGVIQHFRISETDVVLHVLPVHHATGIGITFLPFVHAGACVEFRSGTVDVSWLWERWKRGGVDFFSGVPTIYMRMMRYFEQNLAGGESGAQAYVDGARAMRALLCGTSALPAPVAQFWTRILGGNRRIITRYGATEIGPVFTGEVGCEDQEGELPEGSVGPVFPGVTVKIADGGDEGDEGELLVKSPYMFARYLSDPSATGSAHDAYGFFKTGDIARRQGRDHFILGRASIDILKSGGYKISALDIEREILGLSYVSEAMVVGVADDEFGQRVAAVLCLREDQDVYDPDPEPKPEPDSGSGSDSDAGSAASRRKKFAITDLRRDLRSRLAGYKLPTLLRVVKGELPKSATGKVVKKVLGPQYFPADYQSDRAVQVWRREARI